MTTLTESDDPAQHLSCLSPKAAYEELTQLSAFEYQQLRERLRRWILELEGDVAATDGWLLANVSLAIAQFELSARAPGEEVDCEYIRGLVGRERTFDAICAHYHGVDRVLKGFKYRAVSFHEIGTTSLVLRLEVSHPTTHSVEVFALKLLVVPYSSSPAIANASEQYSEVYGEVAEQCATAATIAASGRTWIMAEFVEGLRLSQFLADQLSDEGTASKKRIDEALALTEALRPLLIALHAKGLGHFDLSPDNIIRRSNRSGDDQYAVVDFGANYVVTSGLAFSREAVRAMHFAPPELMRGTDLAVQNSSGQRLLADAYGLGRVVLDVLSKPTVSSLRDRSLQQLYEGHPLIASALDDLTTRDTWLRLAEVRANTTETIDIAKVVEGLHDVLVVSQVAEDAAGATDSSGIQTIWRSRASFLNRIRRSYHGLNALKVFDGDGGRVRAGRWLFSWLVISAIGTAASVVASLYLIFSDLGWTFGIPSPSSFRPPGAHRTIGHGFSANSDIWAHLVTLSFFLILSAYYRNIFSEVTFRWGRPSPLARCAEATVRSHALIWVPMAFCVWRYPQSWPQCAAFGCLFTAMNNYLVYRYCVASLREVVPGHGSVVELAGEETQEFERQFLVRKEYREWAVLMAAYSLLFFFIWALRPNLHDVIVYPVLVIALNILKVDRTNCHLLAPGIAGAVGRVTSLTRRLASIDDRSPAGPEDIENSDVRSREAAVAGLAGTPQLETAKPELPRA